MTTGTTTLQQPVAAAASRLSPKVRRLLREHDLDPTDIPATNGGRVTVSDVEQVVRDRRAGGPGAGASQSTRRPRTTVASPLVRRLLRDGGVGPHQVVATGTGGRVTREDAERAVEAARRQTQTAGDRGTSVPPAAPAAARGDTAGRSETVELPRTRRTIAERMHESLRTTAQLTAVVEVDMTRLMTAHAAVRDQVQRRTGVPLTPLAPIAHAACRVLRRHPVLNASIALEEGTATYHRDVHLGIAVDTEHGLMVPTVRRAQDLTVAALSERIADLAERARTRELTPDEISGGTFTITNTGSRGVMLDTPILNPPQVGILATTLIEKRPVVVTDEFGGDTLAIRRMSYLCMTYDHRLVDGADAARFLTDLKHELETADLLAGAA